LNQVCIPGTNSTWSWCISLFIYCWIPFANILLSIFMSIFMRDIDLQCSFYELSFVWFWYNDNTSFRKRIRKCFLLFGRHFVELILILFLKFIFGFDSRVPNFSSETLWAWRFLFCEFQNYAFISFISIGLFKLFHVGELC